jgi:hypothetical protein
VQYPLTDVRRRAALDLLVPLVGERPSIVAEEPIGHEWAPVTRLTFDREIPGVGWTAVVKTRRVDGEGYGGPAHLRREEVGLRTAEGAKVAPRVIASNHSVGVVLLTDLGRWPTLESILIGDDADAAAQGMIDLGRSVGRLHATTLHAEAFHREAAMALGGPGPRIERLGPWPGAERWRDVEVMSADLAFPDARVARDDIAFVLQHLLDPSRFAALVHIDLNPTNALVTADGVKLVDFEGSIFGHIGIDASNLHYPFPNYSPHWAVLPHEVVNAADHAYRRELAQAVPSEAMADYDQMLAIGAAATLAVRVQRLTRLAESGQSTQDQWRRRAQLVQQIRVFEQVADRARILLTLADWFSQLADAMADRWDDATSPPPALFPAFRSRQLPRRDLTRRRHVN